MQLKSLNCTSINVLMVLDNIIFLKILRSHEEKAQGTIDVHNYPIRHGA